MKMLVLGDKIEVALMKDIKRQQEANYLAAVKAITKNKPDEAYQLLDGQQSHHEISYRGGQSPPPELRISVVESEVEKLDEDTPFARCFNDLIDGKVNADHPKFKAARGLLRKLKIEGMRENMAEELGARTEDCRDKTITVLDAHTDREIVTEAVRKCDKANHLVSPHSHENISISRLKNMNLTPHQMHDIEHYHMEMVLQKGADKYYEIMSVDKENSVLKLRDLKTNKLSHFAPLRANHHFNGLFEVKASGVALHEQLIMTKTDKAKGIFAKDKMRVTAIDQAKGLVTLTNQEKQNQVILNKHDLSTLHWDYALNTTTLSAQGSDKPFAVLAHKSTSPLSSIRSVYVGLTRGQRHVKVFTDNKAAFLKKIKTEFRDNTIAVNKITGEITLTEFFDRYRSEKQADRSNDIKNCKE